MADDETTGTRYDAPNQQAVREDGSAPWDEGEGGTPGETPVPEEPEQPKPKAKASSRKSGVKVEAE